MPHKRDTEVPAHGAVTSPPAARLLVEPLQVINVGLESFARELAAAGAAVQHVDWSPPANGDPVLAALLAKLDG